jgi:hypothetical protein
MTTTTSYGTWNNRVESGELTVEQSVIVALGDYADDYDLNAIAADYRAAINEALPQGVSLNGDEFYGPYHREDATWGSDLEDEDGRLDIKAIVDGIDFWAIAAEHEIAD